jgi:pimeloyl-ACP methyl ester carboxylesterase
MRPLLWALSAIGLVALGFAALVAMPVTRPPTNPTILEAAGDLDRTGLPSPTRFQARDGTELAYRLYPSAGNTSDILAIAIHGSAGNSTEMNAVAKALAAAGVTVVAPDIRGHGFSGNRGDIAYVGQLEDDLEDLLGKLHERYRAKRPVLLGHSSGGGFALRIAAAPFGKSFDRFVLLAPYLGPFAPTTRDPEGKDAWASPDVPRIVALGVLHRLGITCCEGLQAIAFALPEDQARFATLGYSYRLLVNFGPPEDFQAAFAKAPAPVIVLAGSADTLMDSARYADVVDRPDQQSATRVLPRIDHMGIVSDPVALSAIVAAVKGE